MSSTEIEKAFPKLVRSVNYDTSSDEDFNYNCLAFAVGDNTNWWSPDQYCGYYWPPGFSKDGTVDTVVKIISLHGFIFEVDINETPKAQAIAIYSENNEWTHFAKFADGRWNSKLGDDNDIWHSSLDVLEGEKYGRVSKVMCRQS